MFTGCLEVWFAASNVMFWVISLVTSCCVTAASIILASNWTWVHLQGTLCSGLSLIFRYIILACVSVCPTPGDPALLSYWNSLSSPSEGTEWHLHWFWFQSLLWFLSSTMVGCCATCIEWFEIKMQWHLELIAWLEWFSAHTESLCWFVGFDVLVGLSLLWTLEMMQLELTATMLMSPTKCLWKDLSVFTACHCCVMSWWKHLGACLVLPPIGMYCHWLATWLFRPWLLQHSCPCSSHLSLW